jgi:hypothetical protein
LSRRRPKEIFTGPRLGVAIAPLVRARSVTVLVLLSIFLGVLLAAGLAAGTWYVVQALVHALGSGPS